MHVHAEDIELYARRGVSEPNSPCLNLAVVDRSGLFTRLSHFKIVC